MRKKCGSCADFYEAGDVVDGGICLAEWPAWAKAKVVLVGEDPLVDSAWGGDCPQWVPDKAQLREGGCETRTKKAESRRCGTCVHLEEGHPYWVCCAPQPAWAGRPPFSSKLKRVSLDMGETCPQWEPKPEQKPRTCGDCAYCDEVGHCLAIVPIWVKKRHPGGFITMARNPAENCESFKSKDEDASD